MHVLLIGGRPELINNLVGLPARMSVLQLPDMYNERETAWAQRYIATDYRDVPGTLRLAHRINLEDRLDLVAGFREFSLPAVAAVAKELTIPSVPGPVDTLCMNKVSVRRLLNADGCRPVRYRACNSIDDLRVFAESIGYPVILKPADGTASVGVYLVDRADILQTAWAYCANTGSPIPYLAEEVLTGMEVSVEIRSSGGRHEAVAVTEKLTTGAPHYVETGHIVPARLPTRGRTIVADEAIRAVQVIGHRDGPSHVEVILTEEGPAIVEINRRLGGDNIFELVRLATGRDILRESLGDAVGEDAVGMTAGCATSRAAAVRFLHADQPVRVNDANGLLMHSRFPEVIRTVVKRSDTGLLPAARSSDDRCGYLMLVGPNPDTIAHVADEAYEFAVSQLFTPIDTR